MISTAPLAERARNDRLVARSCSALGDCEHVVARPCVEPELSALRSSRLPLAPGLRILPLLNVVQEHDFLVRHARRSVGDRRPDIVGFQMRVVFQQLGLGCPLR